MRGVSALGVTRRNEYGRIALGNPHLIRVGHGLDEKIGSRPSKATPV